MIVIAHEGESELDKVLKEVCLRYFYLVIAISSIFAIYYAYHNIEPLNYIVGLCSILHIALFAIPYRLHIKSIKPIISVYLIYISVFLYANILFFWSFGQVAVFMWYPLIPIAAMLFFKRRTVVLWTIYVFVHICSVFILKPFLPYNFSTKFTEEQLIVINIMTIIFSISFVVFFLTYLSRVNTLQALQIIEEYQLERQEASATQEEIEKKAEVNMLKELYDEIQLYFSEKKPYTQPDFTITQLSKDLNRNVKYISLAIKKHEDVNFNVFVNRYRVNMVKGLIAQDYHNKYTIRHMYFVAGFRHQSTFNKVFKDIEGLTPSEYIKGGKVK